MKKTKSKTKEFGLFKGVGQKEKKMMMESFKDLIGAVSLVLIMMLLLIILSSVVSSGKASNVAVMVYALVGAAVLICVAVSLITLRLTTKKLSLSGKMYAVTLYVSCIALFIVTIIPNYIRLRSFTIMSDTKENASLCRNENIVKECIEKNAVYSYCVIESEEKYLIECENKNLSESQYSNK